MLEFKRIPGQTTQTNIVWLASRLKDFPYKNGSGSDLPEDEKIDPSPPFQRGVVWTEDQQKAFIISLLQDYPVPAFFINRFPYEGPYEGKEIVIDGKQRLMAVALFLNDDIDIDGEKWSQQSVVFHRGFNLRIAVPVITTEFATMKECAQLYLDLLTRGTAHTKEEMEQAKNFITKQKD